MAGERITKSERQATAVEGALKRLQALYDQNGPLSMYNWGTREDVASVLETLPEKTAEGVWERLKTSRIEIKGIDVVENGKTMPVTYRENALGNIVIPFSEKGLLTRREEIDLIIKVKRSLHPGGNLTEGKEAEEELLGRNYRLIVSLTKKYLNRGLDLEDLFQEGAIGFQNAIRRFDWQRGFKLSTYAVWWINQAMTRTIGNTADIIRHPIDFKVKVRKLNKAKSFLQQQLGIEEPSDVDLADLMETSVRDIQDIKMNWRKDPASLEEPLNDEEGFTLGEAIADPAPGPEEILETKEEKKEQLRLLEELLKVVTPREKEVILKMYGSDPGSVLTLESVGNNVKGKVTRERVRQVKGNAFRKMRNARKNSQDPKETQAFEN